MGKGECRCLSNVSPNCIFAEILKPIFLLEPANVALIYLDMSEFTLLN